MQQILPSSAARSLEGAVPGRNAIPASDDGAKNGAIPTFVGQLEAASAAARTPAASLSEAVGKPAADDPGAQGEPATGKAEDETGKILPVVPGNAMPIAPVAVPVQPQTADVSGQLPQTDGPATTSESAQPTQPKQATIMARFAAAAPARPEAMVSSPAKPGAEAPSQPATDQIAAPARVAIDAPRLAAITLPGMAPDAAPAKASVFEIAPDQAKASPLIAATLLRDAAGSNGGADTADTRGEGEKPAMPTLLKLRSSEDTSAVQGGKEPGTADPAAPTRAATLGEMRVASQPATVPAAPALQPMQHTDMAQMIDRLVEARMAARSGEMQLAVSNADFGKVSVRLESGLAAGSLSFTLANADPDFQPAVQAALAHTHAQERVVAAQDSARSDANPQRGDTQSQTPSHSHSHSHANGQGSASGQHAAGSHGFADQNRSHGQTQGERGRAGPNGSARRDDGTTDSNEARADRGGIFA